VSRRVCATTSLGESPRNASPFAVPPEQREFVAGVHRKMDEFLSSSSPSLELDRMNAFQRKIVFTTVREKFGERLYLESVASKANPRDRVIVATRDGIHQIMIRTFLGFCYLCQQLTYKVLKGHIHDRVNQTGLG
jgi:hypothetical protein